MKNLAFSWKLKKKYCIIFFKLNTISKPLLSTFCYKNSLLYDYILNFYRYILTFIVADELPDIQFNDFQLCSELNSQNLNELKDSDAFTCKVACVYYKIRNHIYKFELKGKCTRKMFNYGTGSTDLRCICNESYFKKYLIIQINEHLFYIYNGAFTIPLGTILQIRNYIKENISSYLETYIRKSTVTEWLKFVKELVIVWANNVSDNQLYKNTIETVLKILTPDIEIEWIDERDFLLHLNLGEHKISS